LKRLVKDSVTAPVIARIFAETLERQSLREIVAGLNRDGILCPFAYDATRNTHRSQDGWQVATILAILRNERYTGFEQWGKFKKVEELVSPTEPALGSKTRLVKNPEAPVRSAKRAHDAIVDVSTYLAVQNELKRRSTGKPAEAGRATLRKTAPYPFRGLVVCVSCGRKMWPEWSGKKADIRDEVTQPVRVRYRCRLRDLAPDSEKAKGHPVSADVQQSVLLERVSVWLEHLFAPENRDTTVEALVGSLAEAPTSLPAIRR
jgi:site-specific DNA recombinase